LPHDPFDGHACLPLIEHERLRVEDAPPVADMGVDADGRRVAARVEPGQTRLVVSMLIMSEEARSDRPQVVAMA
jgi:hypothetical protein